MIYAVLKSQNCLLSSNTQHRSFSDYCSLVQNCSRKHPHNDQLVAGILGPAGFSLVFCAFLRVFKLEAICLFYC